MGFGEIAPLIPQELVDLQLSGRVGSAEGEVVGVAGAALQVTASKSIFK